MSEGKIIREPKQQRSLEKKQRIITAANELFCKRGYYNVSTNEIAKHAQLSIGTLYSYFTDKETILIELLDQYNTYFYSVFDNIQTDLSEQLFQEDKRRWLYKLVKNLIRLHQTQTDFYRELNSLYYTLDIVSQVMDAQEEKIRQSTLEVLRKYKEHIKTDDVEALSVIIVDYTNALVDRVVFKQNVIDQQRTIEAGVEAMYRMVCGSY